MGTEAMGGSLLIDNKSDQKVKVSAIGGAGVVGARQTGQVFFENDENVAMVNLWWVRNARQLCQIETPWERTIIVTGKEEIKCLSKK